MEQTRPYIEMPNDSSLAKIVAVFTFIFSFIAIPAFGMKFGFMGFAIAAFITAAFILPIQISLMFFFFYLFLDGGVKILSNYNPVVHVSQDIFLLSLVARSYLEGRIESWSKTPFLLLFVFFMSSVAIQYVNPFGLGILPSIAGTKVYISSILLFFLVYHNVRSPQILSFFTFIVFIGMMEGAIACVEYLYFPEKIFFLSPKYRAIAGDRFIGSLYRPFGTTSAPGAPSMWIYLCAPFACLLLSRGKTIFQRLLCIGFFAVSVPTLIFCQTRSAMLLFGMMLVIPALAPTGRLFPKILIFTLGISALGIASNPQKVSDGVSAFLESCGVEVSRAESLNSRFMTLFESKTYSKSRAGASLMAVTLATEMPWGLGLSRVGAAAAVWKDRIEKDKFYDINWSFADNVYRAVFTELGVIGLFTWCLLTGTLALSLIRKSYQSVIRPRREFLWTMGLFPLVILFAGIGSEGILYMPVSGFFWMSLALGYREAAHV